MEDFIIAIVSSLPKTILIIGTLSFIVLAAWLFVFFAKRTSAVLTAMTVMLGKLELAVELLKAGQETNTRWLKRHDEEIKELRIAKAKR